MARERPFSLQPASSRCMQPRIKMPRGACDCHMHIFDARFPLAPKARRREPDAPVSAYRKLQRALGLERVVVVQPTAYGRDNRCTLEAIASFGNNARGVAVVDDSISDAEIRQLHEAGMRGVRFRMLDDPELPWHMLPRKAARVAALGWHIQFQMDGRELHTREALLKDLPCDLAIEHIGKFLEPVGVDSRHEAVRVEREILGSLVPAELAADVRALECESDFITAPQNLLHIAR